MGSDIVKAVAGNKYPVYENYKGEKTSVLVTYSSNGTFRGEYNIDYDYYIHDGVWGVNGDILLYTTAYTREEMMDAPKKFSYYLYKVNDDVYVMYKEDVYNTEWDKIEYILVSEDSVYAEFAEE